MYICHKCAKSILPSELVHQWEENVRMPYHAFCLEAQRKRHLENLGLPQPRFPGYEVFQQ
jgi:hypothetical protein